MRGTPFRPDLDMWCFLQRHSLGMPFWRGKLIDPRKRPSKCPWRVHGTDVTFTYLKTIKSTIHVGKYTIHDIHGSYRIVSRRSFRFNPLKMNESGPEKGRLWKNHLPILDFQGDMLAFRVVHPWKKKEWRCISSKTWMIFSSYKVGPSSYK